MIQRFTMILLCSIAFHTGEGFAQSNKDCLGAVKEIYQELTNSDQKEGVYLHFRVSTLFQNPYSSEMDSTADEAKVYIHQSKSLLESGGTTIYKDTDTQVAIMKDKKTVFISDIDKAGANQQLSMLMQTQDSLFTNLVEKSCVPLKEKGAGWVRAVFEADAKLKKGMGMEQVTFVVNLRQKSIESFLVKYTDGSPQQEVLMEILEADYKRQGVPFTGSALAKALQKEKELLPAFASYQLIDVRKSK